MFMFFGGFVESRGKVVIFSNGREAVKTSQVLYCYEFYLSLSVFCHLLCAGQYKHSSTCRFFRCQSLLPVTGKFEMGRSGVVI